MLSGIGSLELLTIGVVALIFIGPKDLPVVFLRVGQFVGRIRGMARDFQTAMSDVARQSGLDDVKTSLDGLGDLNKIGKTSKADTAKNFHNKYLKPLEADKKGKTGKAVKSASKPALKTASHGGARTVPAKTAQPPAESSPSAKSAATAPKKPAVKPAKPVKQKSS